MKKQGFSFDNASNFKFILNLIVNDVGKFILFPFKATLTSFPSNSIMSQSKLLLVLHFQGLIMSL